MRHVDDIAADVLKDKNSIDKFQFLQTATNLELIQKLDSVKDKHPIYNMALVSLIEHMAVLQHVSKNLHEATVVLKHHNIPFNAVVGFEEKGGSES